MSETPQCNCKLYNCERKSESNTSIILYDSRLRSNIFLEVVCRDLFKGNITQGIQDLVWKLIVIVLQPFPATRPWQVTAPQSISGSRRLFVCHVQNKLFRHTVLKSHYEHKSRHQSQLPFLGAAIMLNPKATEKEIFFLPIVQQYSEALQLRFETQKSKLV